jgi:hypothetical protein
MLDGKKTYIGLAVTLAGIMGLTKYIAPEELVKSLTSVIEIFGIAFAAYGRWDKERRSVE